MLRSSRRWAWLPLCMAACSDAPEPAVKPADPWPNQAEILYQTREVIRYVDDQQRLELKRLEALGVDPEPPPKEQGEPQSQKH